MSLDQLPANVLSLIATELTHTDVYRDKYDVARDAASLYAASKGCWETKFMAKEMLGTSVAGIASSGAFTDMSALASLDTSESASVKALKEACAALKLPVSGTKATLVERLNNRRTQRFKLLSDDDAAKIYGVKLAVISAYTAKTTYGVCEKALGELRAVVRPDKAPAYKQREVRELSIRQYGDAETLAQHKRDIEAGRARRRNERMAKEIMREIEMSLQLHTVGCDDDIHSDECLVFIRYGVGNSRQIARRHQEIKFLREHTDYEEIIEDDPAIPERRAQAQAMMEWAHTFPDKAAALNAPGLPPGLRHMMERWPRYMWRVEGE